MLCRFGRITGFTGGGFFAFLPVSRPSFTRRLWSAFAICPAFAFAFFKSRPFGAFLFGMSGVFVLCTLASRDRLSAETMLCYISWPELSRPTPRTVFVATI